MCTTGRSLAGGNDAALGDAAHGGEVSSAPARARAVAARRGARLGGPVRSSGPRAGGPNDLCAGILSVSSLWRGAAARDSREMKKMDPVRAQMAALLRYTLVARAIPEFTSGADVK